MPFIPSEFEKLHEWNGSDVFTIYAKVFQGQEFEGLDWSDYFKEFKRLKEEKVIEDTLPELREEINRLQPGKQTAYPACHRGAESL